ncbi:MAG: sialate O-acetylesterase, partial [Bacteroidota bacterium]
NDPMIRHFKVPRSWAYTPADTLAGGAWDAASPETVGQFSGVGYAFAQHLRAMLEDDVAIGIVNSTWGGSRIEPWMSAAALGTTPEEAEAAEKARVNARLAGLRDLLGELPAEDAGLVDGAALWADPAYDDSSWGTIELGANWESAGYPDLDGVAWYRTTFELTEEQADLPAFVILGMIDDSDQAWINGVSIGSTDMAYNRERRYRVRPSALRPGRNVLAIRVEDFGGGGGINATGNPLSFQSPSGSLLLDGPWRFKVARVDADFSFDKNQIPTLLYNAMIAPLQPFPVRGVIWYQGESNAGTVDDAKAYEDLFAGLIQNWRSDWASPELPFFWAQLAAYHEEDTEPPAESPWATHRASQTAALELPATGQAILTDLGDARDIHPRNKKDVGIRLAQTALNVAYGREDVPRSGPTYAGYELNESRVTVTFDHVGEALMSSGDAVEGFALQSEDGTWAWASAEITGPNTVSVYAASIPAPVGLRFAWADNPSRANLYASNDRPAVPFQIGDLTNRGSSP